MDVIVKSARLSGELRRAQILDAAKSCFARHGFAGTTTKSVAAAAGVSEGLLFRHFPTKAALYAAILSEECEADPCLMHLRSLEPSTATLVTLMQEMACHFLSINDSNDQEEEQRFRLMISSHLDDGEFARLLFEKIDGLLQPIFTASLERAIAAGDAVRIGNDPANLFWFAHHTLMMLVLTNMPPMPTRDFGDSAALERQVCEFVLRGIGVNDAAIAFNRNRSLPSLDGKDAPAISRESA